MSTADICTALSEESDAISRAESLVRVSNYVNPQLIASILPKAAKAIGTLAPQSVIERVAVAHQDAIWMFRRQDRDLPEGFQAFLLLNAEGRDQLMTGTLNLLDPPSNMICRQGERPAAIYVWATFTPGILAAGIVHTFDHFSSPKYADVDLLSTSATIRGHRAMIRYGFEKGLNHNGVRREDLYILRRSPRSLKESRPRYDTYIPAHQPTGITVVHDIGDIWKVSAIRSAVYIGEQSCPFREEFDGNDFAATHLLGYVDDEPAGCMRVRFFGDFAKMERLAVRKEFRSSSLAFDLVRACVDLCREKGFRKLYGHARKDLLPFWQRFGFKTKMNGEPFRFSDFDYIEMEDDIEPSSGHISLSDSPFRLIRPEGRWDKAGVLEASSLR